MTSSPFAVLERDLPRRIIFGLLLVLAVAGIVAVSQNGGGGDATEDRSSAIEALIPSPGSDVLRQSEVGIDLVEGYRAMLTVNGVQIPDDQIVGVPSGDRQPALARYVFSPGAGKVVESWDAGRNCVTAVFWSAAEGPERGTTHTWCFSAA